GSATSRFVNCPPNRPPPVGRESSRALTCLRYVWCLCVLMVNSATVGAAEFIGATPPPQPPKASPLAPEAELATFSVPPGFKVELVTAEPDGGKFVAVAFDHVGRMWTLTAFEYPLDANESSAEAKALFARGGRDRVLVFDTPTTPGRQKPRTFAEGLAIPLGLLPY